MKVIGVIGVIVSVISISVAFHLHYIYSKAASLLRAEVDTQMDEKGLEYLQSAEYKQVYEAIDFQTTYGMIVMLIGTVAILLCIYPAVKKFKVAWFGVVLGLISFVIGMVHGTHLFA